VQSRACGFIPGCVINGNAVRNRTSLNSSISRQAALVTSLLGFCDDTPTTCWVLYPVWHVIKLRVYDVYPEDSVVTSSFNIEHVYLTDNVVTRNS